MRTQRKNPPFGNLIGIPGMIVLALILSLSFLGFISPFQQLHNEVVTVHTGSLQGTIFEKGTSQPLPFVNITLLRGHSVSATVQSASDGSFHLDSVPEGIYSIRATKAGFKSTIEKNIQVKAGKLVTIILVMESGKREMQNGLPSREKERDQMDVLVESKMTLTGGNPGSPASFLGGVTMGEDGFQESRPYPQYNMESYDLIEENRFKTALDNPLSTFSIDVDRASYANVRRFLNHHRMPNKDAVRIEEMINYFEYSYPQPDNGDPFSVTLETGECFWNRDHRLVMIGIKGKSVDEQEIPPANLVFLLDVSGSMDEPNKLPLLKQAFKILVSNLRPIDRVAIVVYAGAAGCVLESTPGSNKEKIMMALENLQAGGSTAGGAGIELAYQVAKNNYIHGGNNRVILTTDGDFNVGASSDAEMTRLIEEKRDEGVFLTILGFGMGNYKDSKMEQISNAGNGNYAYIDNIMEAKKMFGEELWGTLFTIAKDVKIQVEFNPAKVKAYRLIGYENRLLAKEDFNDDRKDAGEIGSGHTVTALYEIILSGSAEEVSHVDPLEYQQITVTGGKQLMTVKLRYKEPNDTVSNLIIRKVEATPGSKSSLSEDFQFASAVAAFGMVLRDSEQRGAASYENVLSMAGNSIGRDPFGYRHEFIQLVEKAKLLTQ